MKNNQKPTTLNNHLTVTLSSEINLEQALAETGIENFATVTKLTVIGPLTKIDFRYIKKKMSKTLQELDLSNATVEKNRIASSCISRLEKIHTIFISDSVNKIDCYEIRSNCEKLASIIVHPDNPNYASDDGVLFNKDKTKLLFYPVGRKGNYIIPNSVTKIEWHAFWGCIHLKSITIPDSVIEIVDGFHTPIFYRCYTLTSIYVHSDNPVYASEDGVLFNKSKTKLIFYPNGIFLDNYIIPDSVFKITDDAFLRNIYITSIIIPDSVIEIGNAAFMGCTRLKKINIPKWVSLKDRYDIVNNNFIFTLPESINEINVPSDHPFYTSEDGVLFNKSKTKLISCPKGKSGNYVIPDSVIEIDKCAFFECKLLTSINISNTVKEINESAFEECAGLISISIPDSIIRIEKSTFSRCHSLVSIIIPDSVKKIGNHAFYFCDNLKSVIIPNSVIEISDFAFDYCKSLVSITIPESVVEISDTAFNGCPALITVHPDNPVYTSENGKLKRNKTSKNDI